MKFQRLKKQYYQKIKYYQIVTSYDMFQYLPQMEENVNFHLSTKRMDQISTNAQKQGQLGVLGALQQLITT